jgi:hypothetical protein
LKKNILISGAGRAGKTTLAKKISDELNYFAISTDELITMFVRAYPHLGIDYADYKQTAANLAPFLGHYLGVLTHKHGNKFVIEGYFDFDKILPILELYEKNDLNEHFLHIGLIYPNQTTEGLFNDIRKYDTEDDWTYNISDDELKNHVNISIEYSKNFRDEFQMYAPVIYDVSSNREQVLDKIVNDIKAMLGRP